MFWFTAVTTSLRVAIRLRVDRSADASGCSRLCGGGKGKPAMLPAPVYNSRRGHVHEFPPDTIQGVGAWTGDNGNAML